MLNRNTIQMAEIKSGGNVADGRKSLLPNGFTGSKMSTDIFQEAGLSVAEEIDRPPGLQP
jgi:hypothetical protein